MKRSRSRSCFNIVRKCVAAGVILALSVSFCLGAGAIGGNNLIEGQIGVVNNGTWQGNIEFISPTMVRGWGRKLSTTATIQAQVFVEDLCCPQNGIFKSISLDANEFRQDLYDAGVGSGGNRGRHGFSWNWDPTGYCAGHRLSFMVTLVSGNQNQWLCTYAPADQRKFTMEGLNAPYSGEHRLVGGVGNAGQRRYWVAQSAVNADLVRSITQAEANWEAGVSGISNPINFARTTTQSSANVEFHYYNCYGDVQDAPGVTYFYNANQSPADALTTNWSHARIVLNSDSRSPFNMYSYAYREATIAHEWGHAMGLTHPYEILGTNGNRWRNYITSTPTDRVMMPRTHRSTLLPSFLDLKFIERLY